MRDRKGIDAMEQEMGRALWNLGEGNQNQNLMHEKYIFYMFYFNIYIYI